MLMGAGPRLNVANGTFRPGNDPRRNLAGRAGHPNRRTVEGEAFARAWLDANANAILGEILASDDLEAKWRAFAFFFDQAHGKARQRIAVSSDEPLAIIIRRAGAGGDAPGAPPAPTDDRESPGALPRDLGRPALGEDPDGV